MKERAIIEEMPWYGCEICEREFSRDDRIEEATRLCESMSVTAAVAFLSLKLSGFHAGHRAFQYEGDGCLK